MQLFAINDSLMNVLLTGNRNTEIILQSAMFDAYRISYLVANAKLNPETNRSLSYKSPSKRYVKNCHLGEEKQFHKGNFLGNFVMESIEAQQPAPYGCI